MASLRGSERNPERRESRVRGRARIFGETVNGHHRSANGILLAMQPPMPPGRDPREIVDFRERRLRATAAERAEICDDVAQIWPVLRVPRPATSAILVR